MSNRTVGLLLLATGVAMLGGTFGLGVLAFLNPDILVEFSSLFPESKGLLRIVGYLLPVALLWVLGSTASKVLSHGLALVREGGGSLTDIEG